MELFFGGGELNFCYMDVFGFFYITTFVFHGEKNNHFEVWKQHKGEKVIREL